MTFILLHGSWHTGAAWHKVERLLAQRGHTVYAPTLSGFESRDKPAGKNIGLQTHIRDVGHLIEANHLDQTLLVGHSYSGLVITGVAEVVPDKIAGLVFLDAFIPGDNQSLFDLLGAESEVGMRAGLVNAEGKSRAGGAEDVWLLPPGDAAFYLGDAPAEDVAWLTERLVYTPVLTFEEKVRVANPAALTLPHSFIRCTEFPYLARYEDQARAAGWPCFQVRAGHDAMLTAPKAVAQTLLTIAGEAGEAK